MHAARGRDRDIFRQGFQFDDGVGAGGQRLNPSKALSSTDDVFIELVVVSDQYLCVFGMRQRLDAVIGCKQVQAGNVDTDSAGKDG